MLALEAVDKVFLAKDVVDLTTAINDGDDEKAADIATDLAIAGGFEALGGNVIPGSVLAIKIVDKLKGLGKTDLANSVEEMVGSNWISGRINTRNMANIDQNKVNDVIEETLNSTGNIASKHTLNSDEALEVGLNWLGDGYKEIGPGVFRSSDNTKQFRIDDNSLAGNHNPGVPHLHIESVGPDGRVLTTNNHIPLVD